jgi:cullin 1
LNQPIKAEVKVESSEVLKTVNDDRKYVIQATIVRIMKAHKTMKNQPLIQEVISQISQRFTPKIPDIKKVGTL